MRSFSNEAKHAFWTNLPAHARPSASRHCARRSAEDRLQMSLLEARKAGSFSRSVQVRIDSGPEDDFECPIGVSSRSGIFPTLSAHK